MERASLSWLVFLLFFIVALYVMKADFANGGKFVYVRCFYVLPCSIYLFYHNCSFFFFELENEKERILGGRVADRPPAPAGNPGKRYFPPNISWPC